MALLFLEGFEGLNRADKYLSGAPDLVATEPGRVLGVAESVNGGTFITPSITLGQRVMIIGFGLKVDFAAAANVPVYIQMLAGSLVQYTMAITRQGNNFVINQYAGDIGSAPFGGTLNQNGNNPFMSFGQWTFFEIRIDLGAGASTLGSAQIRINGSPTAYYNQGSIGFPQPKLASAFGFRTEAAWHFDDIRVFDSTGASENGFAGPLAIAGFRPSAVGNYNQWANVGGAANKTLAVTDGSDSTLVRSSTLDQRQTYDVTQISGLVGSVLGVQLEHTMKVSDIGQREALVVARDGSTDYDYGTPFTVANTQPETYFEVFPTQPSGAAWNLDALNALEYGLKVNN